MHIRPAELADAPALTAIYNAGSAAKPAANPVSYTHLTLPTNREV